jgi:16S rRNA (cytidine1402-2'-O)-methyltransferase
MSRRGTLYLLPTPIAQVPADDVLPARTLAVARRLEYFLAEDAKSARAFLKAVAHPRPLAELRIAEIGHAPDPARSDEWLRPLLDGLDAGIVAEAGCPAVADPGANLVAHAHALQLPVVPLVGPSSLVLTLMASGLNGQAFRFVGYLPQDAALLAARLRELEQASRAGETQLFIETPYRNERLFDAVVSVCAPATRLALAVDLTAPDAFIATRTIAEWRAQPASRRPPLQRRPAVFALLAASVQRQAGTSVKLARNAAPNSAPKRRATRSTMFSRRV